MMIRKPLRPLARILRARETGQDPDQIEAENRAERHAEIQDRARKRAEGRLVFMALGFLAAFSLVGQPDAVSVMDQNFHPGAASVGEQIGVMRLRRTKHLNHPRQNRLRAGAHVERFDRQP